MREAIYFMKRIIRAIELAPAAVRLGGGLRPTLLKALQLYEREGLSGILRGFRVVAHARYMGVQFTGDAGLGEVDTPVERLLLSRVVIVAELSIPQCTRYRVTQKAEMIRSLGVDCSIVSWTDAASCFAAIATHTLAIFYRVPLSGHIENLLLEAKRLRVPTLWEVDDLIFDRNLLMANSTVQRLAPKIREGALDGAVLYRKAMLLCDRGIASTSGLRDAMLANGVSEVAVVENALDATTLHAAALANANERPRYEDIVRIVYGSGTNTHNQDFRQAAKAVLKVMRRYPDVHFRLIGLLDLPAMLDEVRDRIERIPFCNYQEYLKYLSECDVNIAPLEPGEFNDAKSNIKYLEASSVKVPSVCSPRQAFTTAISNGIDGLLADGDDEWERALATLIEDGDLRKRIGVAAYAKVMSAYSPQHIASAYVQPLLPRPARDDRRLKVLSVNVLYHPRSFGGATIVAEQVNRHLSARDDTSVYVFTTLPEGICPAYMVRRYEVDGQAVFGIGMPAATDAALSFDHPRVTAGFDEVLSAVQPDLVHFHSIQDIGVGALDLCVARGVPFVVTAHDAWWVCGRQFMVTRDGHYCRQDRVDAEICAGCVDNSSLNRFRQRRLAEALAKAERIITPSRYFADFYGLNGFDEQRIVVNRNGIKRPSPSRRTKQPGHLRFGYVGGNIALKGVDLVKKAFTSLAGQPIKLVVVDNTINLGSSSFTPDFFKGIPNTTIVPAYTQDTIDQFFDEIDVLLFPTQAKESFGLTVREALARNVWVITTDAGGVVEDIVPGSNGFVIPFDADENILASAVQQTIAVYESIPIGTEIALPHNSVAYFEDQADELATIYTSVVNEDHAGSPDGAEQLHRVQAPLRVPIVLRQV
jgi:glycosyltransferase involved in cell wall biosynthesis